MRLKRLLARKRQQLSHQIGGAIGILFDLHDVAKRLIASTVPQQQQIEKSDHRRQQVIEIVGDPACELTHRLHFLGLGKLFFQSPEPSRIDKIENEICRNAAIFFDGASMKLRRLFAVSRKTNFESWGMVAAPRFNQQFGKRVPLLFLD